MPNDTKLPEQLYICSFCQQPGFTARGLRAHVCKNNNRQPLAKVLVKTIIKNTDDAARIRFIMTQPR